MSNRNRYDLGHYSFQAGRMGFLQTLSVLPVIAGDSITMTVNNIMRLSPLRRTLTVDAQVDYFFFYVPHRHSYGSDWTDLVKEGVDSSVTLDTVDMGTGAYYLAQTMDSNFGTVQQWRVSAYNQIWNRYFRFLKLTTVPVPDTYNGTGTPAGQTSADSPITGSVNQKAYGFPCARLKTPWSTGILSNLIDADRDVASATVMDIIDLKQVQMSYKSKLERDWFSIRYKDVLTNQFGGGSLNIDADERPELIQRVTKSIAGVDINGSGDANLGTYAGKSIAGHEIGFKRKFMPEHGSVWAMCLVRFPTIGTREINPLAEPTQDYTSIAGDYDIVKAQPPVTQDLDDWMSSPAGATTIGKIPFGQYYRHQPNSVHYLYEALSGYPFLHPSVLNTHVKAVYEGDLDYDSVFQTQQLGHWQNYSSIQVQAIRSYPTARQSIYAGVG